VTEVIMEEVKKFLESNEYEITTYQNLWDTAKAILRRKLKATHAYTKNKTKQNRDLSNKQSN
jgi:hypothetical protein